MSIIHMSDDVHDVRHLSGEDPQTPGMEFVLDRWQLSRIRSRQAFLHISAKKMEELKSKDHELNQKFLDDM